MFKNILNNLSTIQKIIILVVIELTFIGLLILTTIITINQTKQVNVQNWDSVDISYEQKQSLQEQLYSFIYTKFPLSKNFNVNDVKIRDGSFKKEGQSIFFIIDIDSLKATYTIEITSDSKNNASDDILINCPRKDQMKYQETFCDGMYNNTSSPELYLPYTSYKSNIQERSTYEWSIMINPKNSQEFIMDLKTCEDQNLYDQRYNAAMKWLKATPIQIDKYHIEIETSCEG